MTSRMVADICGLGASVPGKRRCEQREEIRRSTLEVFCKYKLVFPLCNISKAKVVCKKIGTGALSALKCPFQRQSSQNGIWPDDTECE